MTEARHRFRSIRVNADRVHRICALSRQSSPPLWASAARDGLSSTQAQVLTAQIDSISKSTQRIYPACKRNNAQAQRPRRQQTNSTTNGVNNETLGAPGLCTPPLTPDHPDDRSSDRVLAHGHRIRVQAPQTSLTSAPQTSRVRIGPTRGSAAALPERIQDLHGAGAQVRQ